jgi:hypothetical protein
VAEGRRQPWGLQLHFKDLGRERFLRGRGRGRGEGKAGWRTGDRGGRSPFSALPPWQTLPPGPPPFHQHLFNRNIKGPGPAAPPSASL